MKNTLSRSFNWLVLFCFYFQTLWPTVVFAADVAVMQPLPHHFGMKPAFYADGETDDVYPFDDLDYSAYELFDPSRARASKGFCPSDLSDSDTEFQLSTLYLPMMDTQETEIPGSFSPKALPYFKVLAKSSKDRLAFIRENSLYQHLIVVEEALSWSAYGFDFTLENTGKLFVEKSLKYPAPTSDVLRLYNPNGFIVLAENIKLRHLLAKAESVINEGANTSIDKVDIWAFGYGGVEGEFINEKGARLSASQVTLFEGILENQSEVAIADGGSIDLKGHDAHNYKIITMGNDASLVNARTLRNGLLGIIQSATTSGTYTLEGFRLENLGKILGTRSLHFRTGENSGLVQAESLTMSVVELFTNKSSGVFQIEDRFLTEGTGTFRQEGRLDAKRLVLDNAVFIDASHQEHHYISVETGHSLKVWTQEEGSVVNTTTLTLKSSKTKALVGGTLRVKGKLVNSAASFQNKGDMQVKFLEQLGAFFTNEENGTLEIEDDAVFSMDTLINHGIFTIKGKARGRIDHLLNYNAFNLVKEANLTGQILTNHKIFRARDIFQWQGETVVNHATMTLFDNQISATRQVINHYLMLWTHNTFRTWHILNRGLMARTENLEGKVQPFTVSPDTSTTFKKGMVENRGAINLKTSYTPRMTLTGKTFDHWDNSGKLEAQDLRLQAQSFHNSGEVTVAGSVTGHVQTFTNEGTMLIGAKLDLAGDTFTNNGKVQADQGLMYRGRTLTNQGEWLTPKQFHIHLTGTFLNQGHMQADQGVFGKVHSLDQRGNLLGSMSHADSSLEVETKITTSKGSHWNMHGLTLKAKEMDHQGDLRLASKSQLEIGRLHNLGIIDRSDVSVYDILTLICTSVYNGGFIGFGSLSLSTYSLEASRDGKAKWVADRDFILDLGYSSYTHYGLIQAKKLTYKNRRHLTRE